MSQQLRSLRARLTPGQQRRRVARLERRRASEREPSLPVWDSAWAVRLSQPWNESFVQRRLDQLRSVLSGVYGGRELKKRAASLREHLIACARAAGIQRCGYQHVTPASSFTEGDAKTGEMRTRRTEERIGDPCGGRLRQKRVRGRDGLQIAMVCNACGRAA